MSKLNEMTIAAVRDGLRAKDFTAAEVTDACLDAATGSGPLNAYCAVTADKARAMAAEADTRLAGGDAPGMCGVPLGIKDLFCTQGVQSQAASKILDGFKPEYESTVTSNLWADGAVMLGKLNMDEFAMGSSNETSTGAQNDLQRATDLSRRMVTEFGMSPRLGRMFYSESQASPFLGGAGVMKESVHSEETIREIDLEVKRLVDEAYRSAYEILTSQRATLDHLSRELFELETMTAEQMHEIIDEHRDGPKIVPGTSATVAELDSPASPDVSDVESESPEATDEEAI